MNRPKRVLSENSAPRAQLPANTSTTHYNTTDMRREIVTINPWLFPEKQS